MKLSDENCHHQATINAIFLTLRFLVGKNVFFVHILRNLMGFFFHAIKEKTLLSAGTWPRISVFIVVQQPPPLPPHQPPPLI